MSRLQRKAYSWAKTCLWKVPQERIIKAQFALDNQRCHHNAVMAVYAGRADKVWLVLAGDNEPVVHFINSKDGKFFDETWFNYEYRSYFVIRQVKPDEFDNINSILMGAKRHIINKFGSILDKLSKPDRLI